MMQFPDLATLPYAVTLSAGHARRKKFRKRDDDSTPMKLYYTDRYKLWEARFVDRDEW